MADERKSEQWGSRIGVILAVAGAAREAAAKPSITVYKSPT